MGVTGMTMTVAIGLVMANRMSKARKTATAAASDVMGAIAKKVYGESDAESTLQTDETSTAATSFVPLEVVLEQTRSEMTRTSRASDALTSTTDTRKFAC